MREGFQQKNRVKLLHVVYSLAMGGMENLVLELCLRIKKDCIQQSVCCLTGDGDLSAKFKEAGIKVIYLQKKEGFSFFLPLRVAQLCRREEIDIVHTHDGAANLYGSLGARLVGVKKVFNTEHGGIYFDTKRKKIFNRFLVMLNDSMVCVSQRVKSDLIGMGIPESKLKVISNGIDLERFKVNIDKNAKRISLGLGVKDFVICSVGRLSKEKNHVLLIKAIRSIISRIPETKVLIIGAGPLRSILENCVKEAKLQDVVRLLGKREDVAEILSISDCFAHTSNYESFGLVILEAMASGIPVIATDAGGIKEIVKNNETGILIPKDNFNALIDAIFSIKYNPSYTQNMVLQAKECVRNNFSIERMIFKYTDLYRSFYS